MSIGAALPHNTPPGKNYADLAYMQTGYLERALKNLKPADIEFAIHQLSGASVGGLTLNAEMFLEEVPVDKLSEPSNLLIDQLVGKVFLLKRIINLVLARFYELITPRFTEHEDRSGI